MIVCFPPGEIEISLLKPLKKLSCPSLADKFGQKPSPLKFRGGGHYDFCFLIY